MTLLHVYLGGWAIVFASCLVGLDGISSIQGHYQRVRADPIEFLFGMATIWASYSLPFLGVLLLKRRGRRNGR